MDYWHYFRFQNIHAKYQFAYSLHQCYNVSSFAFLTTWLEK